MCCLALTVSFSRGGMFQCLKAFILLFQQKIVVKLLTSSSFLLSYAYPDVQKYVGNKKRQLPLNKFPPVIGAKPIHPGEWFSHYQTA